MTGTGQAHGGVAGDGGAAGALGAHGAGGAAGTGDVPGASGAAGASLLGTLRLGAAASVTFRRSFPTDAADLWDVVTTPERLARWLGPVLGDLTPGGSYELRMGADEPDSDQNATGVVRSCDPPRSFAVEWRFPGEEPSEVGVRVEAGAPGEGAVLVLVHTRLEDAQAIGYGAGWHTSLDRLADAVVGAEPRDWDARFAARSRATAPSPRADPTPRRDGTSRLRARGSPQPRVAISAMGRCQVRGPATSAARVSRPRRSSSRGGRRPPPRRPCAAGGRGGTRARR